MTSYQDILKELVDNYYYNYKQYNWYSNSDPKSNVLADRGSICFVINCLNIKFPKILYKSYIQSSHELLNNEEIFRAGVEDNEEFYKKKYPITFEVTPLFPFENIRKHLLFLIISKYLDGDKPFYRKGKSIVFQEEYVETIEYIVKHKEGIWCVKNPQEEKRAKELAKKEPFYCKHEKHFKLSRMEVLLGKWCPCSENRKEDQEEEDQEEDESAIEKVFCKNCEKIHKESVKVIDPLRRKRDLCECCFQKLYNYAELKKIAKLAKDKNGIYVNLVCVDMDELTDWKCILCEEQWKDTPNRIKRGSWCSLCKKNKTKGEIECQKALMELGIKFELNVSSKCAKNLKFDFVGEYQGKKFILEFDGEQHFKHITRFHETFDKYMDAQERDLKKTLSALESGYNVIRIDFRKIGSVKEHIKTFLNSEANLYLTSNYRYKYIVKYIKLDKYKLVYSDGTVPIQMCSDDDSIDSELSSGEIERSDKKYIKDLQKIKKEYEHKQLTRNNEMSKKFIECMKNERIEKERDEIAKEREEIKKLQDIFQEKYLNSLSLSSKNSLSLSSKNSNDPKQ